MATETAMLWYTILAIVIWITLLVTMIFFRSKETLRSWVSYETRLNAHSL